MFNGKLNYACQIINDNAKQKGFWSDMENSLEELGDDFNRDFLTDYGKNLIKSTKNAYITQKIALVISECSEAIEAIRKDKYCLEEKDTFEDEIADAIIRLLDLCGQLNIDIEKQIEWKMKYNASRQTKHGKNF